MTAAASGAGGSTTAAEITPVCSPAGISGDVVAPAAMGLHIAERPDTRNRSAFLHTRRADEQGDVVARRDRGRLRQPGGPVHRRPAAPFSPHPHATAQP